MCQPAAKEDRIITVQLRCPLYRQQKTTADSIRKYSCSLTLDAIFGPGSDCARTLAYCIPLDTHSPSMLRSTALYNGTAVPTFSSSASAPAPYSLCASR